MYYVKKIKGIKRKRGSEKTKWMDCIKGDFYTLGVVNWRRMPLEKNKWRKFLKQAKTHPGLQCQ